MQDISVRPLRGIVGDSQRLVQEGIRALLAKLLPEGSTLLGTVTASELRRAVASEQPNFLVADVQLCGGGHLPILREWLAAAPATHLLVTSDIPSSSMAANCLNSGARGFVLKSSTVKTLALALQTILNGDSFLDSNVVIKETGLRSVQQGSLPRLQRHDGLTDRELEVLSLLAIGYTNAQIAKLLFVCLRTVETERAIIRSKLGVQTRSQLTAYARSRGVIPDSPCWDVPEKSIGQVYSG